jgi:HEAT repeat protein
MRKDEAIAFLQAHQPLPGDEDLSQDVIATYDEARKLFLVEKDPTCIPLFLSSFGAGSGFGVYQLVEDVLLGFSAEEVVPHLVSALVSEHPGVRYWCAQIAVSFPDERLIPALFALLEDASADTRIMAVVALGRIGSAPVRARFRKLLEVESDEDVIEAAREELEPAG